MKSGYFCGLFLHLSYEFFGFLPSQGNVTHGTTINGNWNGTCELKETACVLVVTEGDAAVQFLEGDGLESFQTKIKEAHAADGVYSQFAILAELELISDTTIKGETDAIFDLVQGMFPRVYEFAAEPELLAEQLGNLFDSDIYVHVTNLLVVLKKSREILDALVCKKDLQCGSLCAMVRYAKKE